MPVVCSSLGALAVAMIFYAYRDLMYNELQNQRKLCGRVAFMLWAMVDQAS